MAFCFTRENFEKAAYWCCRAYPENDSGSYWRHIGSLLSSSERELMNRLNLVWIELDSREFGGSGTNEPALFFEISPAGLDTDFIAGYALPMLTGGKAQGAEEQVRASLELLPKSAIPVHIGYFPARSPNTVRITAAFDNPAEVLDYCGTLFGRKMYGRMSSRITELAQFAEFFVLHLDIGRTVEPRIGIELRFREHEQELEYQQRWNGIFTYLTERGLCTQEYARAILQFPGVSRYLSSDSLWPLWYRSFVYYIKGVFDFSGTERFKAYCAFKQLVPHERYG